MKTKRLIWLLGLALLIAFLVSGTVFAEGEEISDPPPVETSDAPPAEPTETESPTEETTASEPLEESAPVEPAPESDTPEAEIFEAGETDLAPDKTESTGSQTESESQAIPSSCDGCETQTDVTLVDSGGAQINNSTSDNMNYGDPWWIAGGVKYAFVYNAPLNCPDGTIYTSTCFDSTDARGPIWEALDYMNTHNLAPTDGLLHVLYYGSGYPADITIDGISTPNLAGMKGIIGYPAAGGSLFPTLNGYVNIGNLTGGFTLSGFTINGGVTFINNSGNLVLSNLVVKNTAGNGIYVDSHIGNITLTNVKSSGNSGGASAHGAVLNNPAGGNVTVINSAFDHNTHASIGRGLWIDSGGIVTINGLSATGNSHQGLTILGFSRLSLSNAVVKNNGESGINISSPKVTPISLQNVYAIGNTGTYGISINTAGSVTALNTIASGNSGTSTTGLYIYAANGTGTVRVTNGQFNDNSDYGLLINSKGTITLTSVQAMGNGSTGAYLVTSSGSGALLVTSPASAGAAGANRFDGNGNYGLQIYGGGAVTLTNLQACGNGNDGLYIRNDWGTGNVTINKNLPEWVNRFDGNGMDGAFIFTLGNLLISDLSASGNLSENGLSVFYTTKNVAIYRARFDNNKQDGAIIEASGALRLTDVTASGNGVGDFYSGLNINNTYGSGAVTILSSVKNVYQPFLDNTKYGIRVASKGAVSISWVRAEENGWDGIYVDNKTDTRPAVTLSGVIARQNNLGVQIQSKGTVSARDLDVGNNTSAGLFIDNSQGTGSVLIATSSKTGMNHVSGNSIGISIYSKGNVAISNTLAEYNNGKNTIIDNTGAPIARTVTILNSAFNDSVTLHGLEIQTIGHVTLSNVSATGNFQHGAHIDATSGTAIANVTVRGVGQAADFSGNGAMGLNIATRGAVTLQNIRAEGNGTWGIHANNRWSGSAAPVRLSASKGLQNSASGNLGTYGLYIQSYGAISIANLLCEDNQQYGTYLWNTRQSTDLPVQAVAIAGSTFSGAKTWDGLYISSEGPVTIRDSRADGNKQRGMEIITKGTVTLSGITAIGNQGSAPNPGVRVTNTSGDGNVIITSSKAVQTEFSWNLHNGISISTNGVVSIANASAQHNSNYGINVSQSASVSVTNTSRTAASRFSENGDRGLVLISTGPVTLSGNILVENNGGYGVFINNSFALSPMVVTISGVTASGNTRNGIYVQTTGDVLASNLFIERNGFGASGTDRHGFYINNYLSGNGSGSVTLSGRSTFSHNNNNGLYLTSNGVINVSGVTAYGNGSDGLYVIGNGTGKSVTLRDITTINNVNNGLYLEAMGDQTLRGITSLMNGGHGIETWLQGYYALLHSCMVMGNDGHGIYIHTGTTGSYSLNSCVYIGNDADKTGEKDLFTTI